MTGAHTVGKYDKVDDVLIVVGLFLSNTLPQLTELEVLDLCLLH